jgi:cytochrome o ubiquinol oxidase subunit 2
MNKKYKIAFFILIFGAALLFAALYLKGIDIAVLNPKGMIALKERKLIIVITLLMLIVVVPTFFLTIFFAWKYREGNTKAKYTPDWDRNPVAESIWWGLPCAIILIIAVIGWKSCHELDPFKSLASSTKPIKIQVVALQWKWLFIYPDHNIATVNFIQFPEHTPINFEITADAPMNSFWIPQLGGQIYAMPGMRSKLHLIANEMGSFRGSSANLSGKGFSDMRFVAKSSSQVDFDNWIESVKQSFHSLDFNEYNKLSKPSENNPAAYYLLEEKNLYDQIVMKYMGAMKKVHSASRN